MKLLHTFLAFVAITCSQVFATYCEPVAEWEVTPGYKVRLECNLYRHGPATPHIASVEACAILCRHSGIPGAVCSYSEAVKICVVAQPDAPLISKHDIFLMTPIEENTCSTKLEACQKSHTKFEEELNQAIRDLDQKNKELAEEKNTVTVLQNQLDEANIRCKNCPIYEEPTRCGAKLHAFGGGVVGRGTTREACKAKCLSEPSCHAYNYYNGNPKGNDPAGCRLYNQATKYLTVTNDSRCNMYDRLCKD
ncbi:hypothetical protein FLONG3_1088 [Fusarium longipes]|uniref:Apple domain-containing protein n=1 Tax=Fusarium longipes TaxID=694270 RepID=A0A395T7Q5_9HYPO|nr:hypothetical protein FLONG3_1088 [Fusarium longipes]